MRFVLVAYLVLVSAPAHATRWALKKSLPDLVDLSGKVNKIHVLGALPNIVACVSKEVTFDVLLDIDKTKVRKVIVSGSGDPKLDACVKKLMAAATFVAVKTPVTAKITYVSFDADKPAPDKPAAGK